MKQAKYQKNDYYRSLTRKMILTIIIVSFTPLILVGSIILYRFHVSYHEKMEDHLQELVLKHKQTIDNFLKEKLGDIRLLSETFCFDELKDASFLQDRLDLLQQSFGPVFVDLGVVNSQGLQVAYAGPFRLGEALYFEADWFKKAMKTQVFHQRCVFGSSGTSSFYRSGEGITGWVTRGSCGRPLILWRLMILLKTSVSVKQGLPISLTEKENFKPNPFSISPQKMNPIETF